MAREKVEIRNEAAPSQALPKGNVAAVEAAYEALAHGGLERFLDHWTDDLDYRSVEGALDDRGPILGRQALRRHMQDWIDTFDEFKVDPVELIDGGGDLVVGVMRYGGRAKLSGIKTDETYGVVLAVRDGRIAGGREYETRGEALAAARLRE